MRLHQFVPVLDPGDAVANHARRIRSVLRAEGVDSEIYCQQVHPSLAGEGRPVADDTGGAGIYHVAIGSELADHVLNRPDPFLLDHHHLTPLHHVATWDPRLVHGTAWGRRQLPELARRCQLGMVDSHYNGEDLTAAGCGRVRVVPILFDPDSFHRPADAAVAATLARARERGGAQWLFVGRLVPNKAQHTLVQAFAAYHRHLDAASHLWLVGGASSPVYEATLRSGIEALGLGHAITLTGPVSQAALSAHFEAADVFTCASVHEGFCVPLLEAMHHRLPIVARAEAAVPETAGSAALLVPDASPERFALAVARVVQDGALRAALVEEGQRRLRHFSPARTRQVLLDAVAEWIR